MSKERYNIFLSHYGEISQRLRHIMIAHDDSDVRFLADILKLLLYEYKMDVIDKATNNREEKND